jgi:hypothetical protein
VAIVSSGAGDPPWVSSSDADSGTTRAGVRRLRTGRLLAAVERLAVGRRLAGERRLALVRRFPLVRCFAATRRFAVVRRFELLRRLTGARFLRAERVVAARFLRFAMVMPLVWRELGCGIKRSTRPHKTRGLIMHLKRPVHAA